MRISRYLSQEVNNPYIDMEVSSDFSVEEEFVNLPWQTNLWTHYTIFLLKEKMPNYWYHQVARRDIGE